MKKIWFVLGIILIIVLIFLFKPTKREDTVLVSTIPVVKGDLNISISAKGVIQPKIKYNIKSKLSGIINNIKVKEGDRVSSGEILLTLDPTEYLVRINEIKKDILAYKNKLDEYEHSLEIKQPENTVLQAKMDLENASKEYESYKRLYEVKAVSYQELKKAEVELQKAKMNYNNSSQNLEYKQQIINNEKNLIQVQIQQANTQLEWANRQLEWTKIISPISGIVLEKNPDIETGSPINSGMSLLTIGVLREYKIEALIDEVDREKIYVGQTATVKVDAYPYQLLSGKVVSISPQPVTSSQGIKSFKVTINFDCKNLLITPEMNCDVEIIATIPNVIKLQFEAIIESEEKRYAFVVRNGVAIRRQIKTKLESITEAQIISGVSIGDRIIINPSSTLKDGEKIKEKI
jgi:HlyD family secretion protein